MGVDKLEMWGVHLILCLTTVCFVGEGSALECQTIAGEECIFPFLYQGEEHQGCYRQGEVGAWCATQVDNSKNMVSYGICNTSLCRGSELTSSIASKTREGSEKIAAQMTKFESMEENSDDDDDDDYDDNDDDVDDDYVPDDPNCPDDDVYLCCYNALGKCDCEGEGDPACEECKEYQECKQRFILSRAANKTTCFNQPYWNKYGYTKLEQRKEKARDKIYCKLRCEKIHHESRDESYYCDHFSWNRKTKECLLFMTKWHQGQAKDNQSVISSTLSCGETAHKMFQLKQLHDQPEILSKETRPIGCFSKAKIVRNWNSVGVHDIVDPTNLDCFFKCFLNNCDHFGWNADDHTCRLLVPTYRGSKHWVSGPRFCDLEKEVL